jgi:hypothetical protein
VSTPLEHSISRLSKKYPFSSWAAAIRPATEIDTFGSTNGMPFLRI